MSLSPDGDVVVLDRHRESVVWFSRIGRWIRTVGGSRGKRDLRLDDPSGMAWDGEGYLWIVDRGNHRLVVLDEEGNLLKTIGRMGKSDGRFLDPTDLTFDRRGRIYVADGGNERIQVLRRDGRFLEAWDRRTGGRRGHLEVPIAVAYSGRGRGGLWVLNRGWTRLERFDLEGEWEESLELSRVLEGDLDLRDVEIEGTYYRMVVSDAAGRRVAILDRRGELEHVIGEPGDSTWAPRGLVIDRQLDLYVADRHGQRVLKFKVQ